MIDTNNLLAALGISILATLVWMLLILQDIRFRLPRRSSPSPTAPMSTASSAPAKTPYRILSSTTPSQTAPAASTPIQLQDVYDDVPDLQFSSSGRGWTGQPNVRNMSGIDISEFLG